MPAGSYRMKTTSGGDGAKSLTLPGGDDQAVLYAAYHFAGTLGVRFYLHGDVVPDRRIPFDLPDLDETHAPLFETRGILPFHDFTQGPDWWEADDYKACLTQMVKMRMNLLALHCYPEGEAGPEPLVWIGHPDDVDADGKVSFSPPSATLGPSPWKVSVTSHSMKKKIPADAFDEVFAIGFRLAEVQGFERIEVIGDERAVTARDGHLPFEQPDGGLAKAGRFIRNHGLVRDEKQEAVDDGIMPFVDFPHLIARIRHPECHGLQ